MQVANETIAGRLGRTARQGGDDRRGRAANAVMAGILLASMGFGLAVPARAHAQVSYGKGAITIQNVEGNQTSFEGYQIFKANVKDDSSSSTGKREQNVAWASDDVATVVAAAIKAADPSYAGTTAQDAAAWMEGHLAGFHTGVDDKGAAVTESSADAAKNRTWVDQGTFANQLAVALSGSVTPTEVSAGSKTQLDEGWWLFVTKDASLSTEDSKHKAGTSAVYALVGAGDVVVSEKVKLPNVDKDIKSDVDGSWGKVADSQRSQQVNYRLTGTVSGNINTFDTYSYAFKDQLSAGLTLDAQSVRVKLYDTAEQAASDPDGTKEVGKDVTDKFTRSVGEANELDVSIADLKSLGGVTGSSTVVVYYSAHLNGQAVIGGTGNPNSVRLVYSNNPYSKGTGETAPHKVVDYTYQLVLNKVDRNTEVRLQGAGFQIKAEAADDAESTGRYVQEDGSLGDEPHTFVTDATGAFAVKGLDAGTYKVHEADVPEGYAAVPDFTFTIEPTLGGEDGMTLTELTTKVTGRDGDVIAGVSDGKTGDNRLDAAADAKATDVATGTVTLTVGDAKETKLPLTGEDGIGVAVGLGSTGLVISVAGALMRRRTDRQQG